MRGVGYGFRTQNSTEDECSLVYIVILPVINLGTLQWETMQHDLCKYDTWKSGGGGDGGGGVSDYKKRSV